MARHWEVLAAIPDNDLLAFGVPMKMNSYRFRDVRLDADLEVTEHFNRRSFVLERPQAAAGLVAHHGFGFLRGVLIIPEDFSRFVTQPSISLLRYFVTNRLSISRSLLRRPGDRRRYFGPHDPVVSEARQPVWKESLRS